MTEHSRTVGPPEPLAGTDELFSLDRAVLHLNHGSFGSVPVPVQRIQRRFHEEQEADPDGFYADLPERVAAARTRIAAALGTDADRLALVPNATDAIAVTLACVPLAPGDQILVTDHGYGTVTQAVRRRAEETGAELRTVTLPLDTPDGVAVRETVLAEVTDRTVLAVLDGITSPTARRIATPDLLAALRGHGVTTVVDAAHEPGMLAGPVPGGADFWFGNLHKWAFAPRATGALVVGPEWTGKVRSLALSWEDYRGFPHNVEWRGTYDYTPYLAAPAGLDLLHELGADRVRRHNEQLAAYGAALLAERAGLTPLPVSAGLSMRALRLPPGVAETLPEAQELMAGMWRRHAVRTVARPWPGGGVMRVSAQVYNRAHEYEVLAAGVAELLG
ncbi:aminotransferase class V-fold PLP-dependent enzyme [Streptomyces sp. BE20]|uniref:aminotransferase class V-fold PLP-dependent enzyme n=1 Tax=Streptomyces sp. BE20 TaxID=3002525 RepID=UPI002E782DE7|nr:aminotransferase class V-fold PLP-dependent enzyme [Streptomyces sp. BE20]MEE1821041.1 aminotransferase class V-fold PLP-dependent enzyme [Streptomyces sp. BE20]